MKFGYVKVGAYTPEIKVADTSFNESSIIDGIKTAQKEGIQILVFPELCITGYTCGDLFYHKTLLDGAFKSLLNIVDLTKGNKTLCFLGLPLEYNGLIYNVSCAISDGEILGIVPKTFLPNFNDSYEKRYFAPAFDGVVDYVIIKDGNSVKVPFGRNIIFNCVQNPSLKVATEFFDDLCSLVPPSLSHALKGATVIANLSASVEMAGKAEYRRSVIKSHTSRCLVSYISSNAGEGESTTDVVYSGHNIIAERGKILSESKLFTTGLIASEVDIDSIIYEREKAFNQRFGMTGEYKEVEFNIEEKDIKLTRKYEKLPFVPSDSGYDERLESILNIQAEGLKKRIKHTNAKTLVIGLSGGLDSTLAILVSVKAMNKLNRSLKDILAVTMPCFGTTSRTFDNTVKLSKSLGVSLKKVDIGKSVKRHLKDIGHSEEVLDTTYENSQARERTQVLMDIANDNNGMVIGTGDLSELALGWATYNGDHMSMYGVNCSVPKTLVRRLVDYVAQNSKGKLKSVLCDILDTPVSPELLPPTNNGTIAQKTEDIVGPYVLHDFFLYNMFSHGFSPKKLLFVAKETFKDEFDEETILKWLKIFIKRFFSQQFKRSCVPDGIKVGSVCLSPRGDLRMPSDAMCSLWQKELENL